MSFVSAAFFVLLFLVLGARLTAGRTRREPFYLALLLAASLLFYGWHVPAYLALLLTSAVVDFHAGRRIAAPAAPARRRKSLLVLSLMTNLGLLGFFKYSGFAVDSVRSLLVAVSLDAVPLPRLDVVLPIGISFFTFQSMSYTLDIYRGRLQPIASFWRFLLFVAFFPQLVAGPIVRASEFLYQLGRRRAPRLGVWCEGAYLIVRGLFLKMVLADNLAPVVDSHWSAIARPGTDAVSALTVTFLFSCQIFCDFAGYSSIARGTAYLLGFRLPVNFRSPYIAASFREFWTRWHITLSRWLRDYLYIPLGGNRVSKRRTYLNLLLVMLLGGLWHGAAWTFVVWGGLHGLALAVERLFGLQSTPLDPPEGTLDGRRRPLAVRGAWFFAVQLGVLVTWVFFRSPDLAQALAIVGNFFALGTGTAYHEPLLALVFALPVVLMHGRAWLEERGRLAPADARDKAVWAGIMLYLIVACYGTNNAFIYFQF